MTTTASLGAPGAARTSAPAGASAGASSAATRAASGIAPRRLHRLGACSSASGTRPGPRRAREAAGRR
eukprot:8995064-Alexandrium_andersonii.AAC.1